MPPFGPIGGGLTAVAVAAAGAEAASSTARTANLLEVESLALAAFLTPKHKVVLEVEDEEAVGVSNSIPFAADAIPHVATFLCITISQSNQAKIGRTELQSGNLASLTVDRRPSIPHRRPSFPPNIVDQASLTGSITCKF